jgi:anti-sigma regulatory factor (Ser/Thr protein kinase)
MNGAADVAAAELDLLLPRIAASMRRPSLVTRAASTVSTNGLEHKDVTFALDTQLSSVGVARGVTASLLRRWHVTSRAYDVTTVVSELVTNALRHGAPLVAREWVILLRLINHLDAVVCVVGDPNTIAPVLREPDFVAETGRGLHVVQSYSRRWGWRPCPSGQGKIVWAAF